MVEEGSYTADEFCALYNQGNVNTEGITDGMDWNEMGQDDLQYQLNDADNYYIS